MKTNWNYQDIIDLEYFMQLDGDSRTPELHKRDREIYLSLAATDDQTGNAAHTAAAPGTTAKKDTRTLLRLWLTARRETSDKAVLLPGSYAAEAHTLLQIATIVGALFIGSSAGLTFLGYSGATPVNVLNFLVLFVFSQLLLTLVLLSRGLLSKLGASRAKLSKSITIRLAVAASCRLGNWLLRRKEQQIGAEKRLAMQAALGRVQAADSIYRGVFYWPLFALVQLFGIWFNIGLLAAIMLKITVSDVAFGWQSTLQFSAASLHNFISWLALPWSWLISPPNGYPGLSEIEGSRIILKDGIANLQTPDLVSWWPFLLLAVLCYGLLIRLLLFGWGKYRCRCAAQQLRFDTPALRQVLRRMQTPVVSTQARPEPAAAPPRQEEEPEEIPTPEVEEQLVQPISLLLPDELSESCDRARLETFFQQEGFTIADMQSFMADYDADQQLLADFRQKNWQGSAGVAIIQEAWMPPLVSFLSYLKEMREAVGALPIMIRLTGKPSAQSPFTPVADELQLEVWQQKIDTLGDPYIELRPLIEEQ